MGETQGDPDAAGVEVVDVGDEADESARFREVAARNRAAAEAGEPLTTAQMRDRERREREAEERWAWLDRAVWSMLAAQGGHMEWSDADGEATWDRAERLYAERQRRRAAEVGEP